MVKLRLFQKEKKYYFFLYCATECKANDVESITSPRFCLLIREQNYETAMTYMNPRLQWLVRWRQLLIRWNKLKIAKIDRKKSQAKKWFLHNNLGTIAQPFTKKNLTSQSLSNIYDPPSYPVLQLVRLNNCIVIYFYIELCCTSRENLVSGSCLNC